MRSSRPRRHGAALLLVLSCAATPLAAQTVPAAPRPAYVPHRVYDARHKRFVDFETLAQEAAKADVVFFGEQHDDPGTHAMELALLDALARRRGRLVLSLEMFERDAQPALDRYLAGSLTETDFLAGARPWPNYASDYRPMVELARARGWPVVAANVPRRLASAVARGGLAALDTASGARDFSAADRACGLKGGYYDRFVETMQGHGAGGAAMGGMSADRFYEAQCVKDETMAEAVAAALARAGDGALVVHVTGGFHVERGEGTAERVRRRAGGVRSVVVAAIPAPDLDRLEAKGERKRGDFLLYTLAPPAAPVETKSP